MTTPELLFFLFTLAIIPIGCWLGSKMQKNDEDLINSPSLGDKIESTK